MFSIHGEWEIEVCGHVVVQWFSGGWNEEAVISYVKEFRSKATPLIDKEWAILSIFEEWDLGIPEISKHVEEHCNWFKSHGCVKDCHVYTPNATKEMQLERLIPQTDAHYERKVFTNTAEALAWLASYNFNIENSVIINTLETNLHKHSL
tara:strand:- start:21 stop:470 length:450 start_codon:yes stop_codon:yes gene_type:complete